MAMKKDAPASASLAQAFPVINRLNIAAEINAPEADTPPKEIVYNCATDESRAAGNRVFLHDTRSQAEFAAACSGDLPAGTGLSLRMAMAGQGENDQWPYRTDEYGKQRN